MGNLPFSRCERHDRHFEWIKTDEGRSVLCCPNCRAGHLAQTLANRQDMPLIKWGQNFWRDRPLTEKEKQHPPRRVQ